MYRFEENKTKRNKFTRVCIGESLIYLMQEMDYERIQIKDIAQKAGVSRMTYYHYYETKEDVLTDFIYEIINKYVSVWNEYRHNLVGDSIEALDDDTQISFAVKYFSKFDILAQTMSKHNLDGFVIKTVNEYIETHFDGVRREDLLKMRFISAGIYNILL